MHAIVLVGGFGTRLRPLTLTTPKPMLPVGHAPIIERLVHNLASGGVDHVVLALGFKPEPFTDAFPDGVCAGVPLHYAVEPEPLDTAGAIGFAARHAGIETTFVVANGDVLTDLDIGRLVDFHHDRSATATLHLTPVDDPSSFGVADVDDRGRVQRFVEKPPPGEQPSNLINGGTYVLERSVLDRIPTDRPSSIERETFPAIVAEGGLFGLSTDDYWIDVGRPETYLRANLDIIDGCRRMSSVAVAEGAVVDPRATVERSIVARDATVESGAVLLRSVILAGAHIGQDAHVEDSVVMGAVGTRASIVRCVIGAGGSAAAGSAHVDARFES